MINLLWKVHFADVPCRRFQRSHTCDDEVVSVLICNWRYLMTKISMEFPPFCYFLDKYVNSYMDIMKVKGLMKYIFVERWIMKTGIVGVTCVIYEWFVIAFVTMRTIVSYPVCHDPGSKPS